MRIELLSEAVKLAVDCIYEAIANGYVLEEKDYDLSEKIVIELLCRQVDFSDKEKKHMKFVLRASRRNLNAYFSRLEEMLNNVLNNDGLLSGLGNEAQLRNDLQYLVCLADAARDEMEKAHEEASTIIQTAS